MTLKQSPFCPIHLQQGVGAPPAQPSYLAIHFNSGFCDNRRGISLFLVAFGWHLVIFVGCVHFFTLSLQGFLPKRASQLISDKIQKADPKFGIPVHIRSCSHSTAPFVLLIVESERPRGFWSVVTCDRFVHFLWLRKATQASLAH